MTWVTRVTWVTWVTWVTGVIRMPRLTRMTRVTWTTRVTSRTFLFLHFTFFYTCAECGKDVMSYFASSLSYLGVKLKKSLESFRRQFRCILYTMYMH